MHRTHCTCCKVHSTQCTVHSTQCTCCTAICSLSTFNFQTPRKLTFPCCSPVHMLLVVKQLSTQKLCEFRATIPIFSMEVVLNLSFGPWKYQLWWAKKKLKILCTKLCSHSSRTPSANWTMHSCTIFSWGRLAWVQVTIPAMLQCCTTPAESWQD